MAQLIGLGIENFRVFKEYTEFDFAPITLLTGANNSGKSSLIKALLLLAVNANKKLERFTVDYELESRLTKLGNFESITHNSQYPITFKLYFDNVFEEIARPIHKEEVAGYIFRELAKYQTAISLKSNGLVGENLCYFTYEIFTNGKWSELFSFEFDKNTDNITSKINFIEIKKILEFILSNNQLNFRIENQHKEEEREIDNSIISDIYTIIDLIFEDIVIKLKEKENGKKFTSFKLLYPIFKRMIEIALRAIEFGDKIEYLPAFRGNQERFYSYESDLALNRLLKQFTDKGFKEESKEQTYLNYWIERLGIGKKIDLIPDIGGTKVNISNGTDRPMADYGFGITQLLPLLLKIVLNPNKILLVEEGENSLHPNFQSQLADLLIDAHKNFGIHFIVETHSEYLIRKLRVLTKIGTIDKEDSIIYYFQTENEGEDVVKKIQINHNGAMTDEFGSGFINEADNLTAELYELPNRNN